MIYIYKKGDFGDANHGGEELFVCETIYNPCRTNLLSTAFFFFLTLPFLAFKEEEKELS